MNWHKVNIKQGQAIIAANALEPWERDIAILVALHGKDMDYYESLPKMKVYQMIAATKWIETLPVPKLAKAFQHGNYFYKFRTMPDQLSQSDFALLQRFGQNHVENLHKILALLSTKFRIITPKECKMDFEERAELFLNKMPFDIAYAYCLFFSTYYPHLLSVGLHYSLGVKEAAESHLSATQS